MKHFLSRPTLLSPKPDFLNTGPVEQEVPLEGGFVNHVTLVNGHVRRPAPASAEFVHSLLRLFEQAGWTGAPRVIGITSDGREMLSYIDGSVVWETERLKEAQVDQSLAGVARLVRQFHDLTAGDALAGASEVVCHNDLSPKNTVYVREHGALQPVAFIDWDLAAPGKRVHDVAHICWQYLRLGPDVNDVLEAAGRMRLIADAYGMTASTRDQLVGTVLWWQDRCWRGIEEGARAGNESLRRLCVAGVPEQIRVAFQWVTDHRSQLEYGLARKID